MSDDIPVIFSPHAVIKLAQRGLTRSMVIRTVVIITQYFVKKLP